MAKKRTQSTTTKPKEFSFLELDKELSKIKGFEMGSILETNEFSEVHEWIPTGNYALNAQISGSLFGGIPDNRSIGIAGDPQTGKSFVCMNIVREAQNLGYDIIYCDTEGAIDRTSAKKFGIDTKKLRYQPIKNISDFKIFTVNLADKIKAYRKSGIEPKIALFLDSLGMLTTDKESSDALKGKSVMDMGIRAKELRSLFRNITIDLTGARIPLICTNHTTTAGIGTFITTKEASGGDGPIFSMSSVIMLTKAQLKVDDTKTGIIVTSNLKKSRFTRPFPIKFHISFMNGMNQYVGLQDFVSWDVCGIQRGTMDVDKKTGEIDFHPNESSTRWAIKHLGKTIVSKELFTKEVFTQEVLQQLDDKVIKDYFLLPDLFDLTELDSLLDDENGADGEE